MKQILPILLAAALVYSLTACGQQGGDQTGADAKAETQPKVQALEATTGMDPQQGYPMEAPQAFSFQTLEQTSDEGSVPMALTGGEKFPLIETKVIKKSSGKKGEKQEEDSELRAVWISYLDFESILTGKSKSQFTANIYEAFDKIKGLNLNTVIVQVRPFGDAMYESEYFPWSYVVTGTEGKDPGFDPLEIMVKKAHEKGLDIEAWVNPYRVRMSGKKEAVSKDNPVNAMVKTGDALKYSGGTYYNPASEKAQELIVNGVKEIVSKYDVDGIHFDDYFYPTTDSAFDTASYSAYQKQGGKDSLGDWRRENVNQLVRKVYAAIKEINQDVTFGISPQGNMKNNYDGQFVDVALWLSEEGYVDYICPQIYFGFKNQACPYGSTVKAWNSQIKADGVKLYVGLAPYKIGTVDSWAGEGKYEWANSSSMLSDMVAAARNENQYGGFILFRYDSIFNPGSSVKKQVNAEIQNLVDILE